MRGRGFVTVWQQAGPHRYHVERDRIRWHTVGAVEPQDAHAFASLLIRVSSEHGHAYCLVDGSQMQPLPAESRRVYLDYLKQHAPRFALAIFGAPLHMRVAGMLVIRAARLMSLPDLDVCYTATEQEAEAYLQARRAGPPPPAAS